MDSNQSVLDRFHYDGDLIEVRPADGADIRYFTSNKEAEDYGLSVNGSRDVWTNINPITRRPAGKSAADSDISCHRWIVIDCDPVGPVDPSDPNGKRRIKGCATDDEKLAAYDLAAKVYRYVTDVLSLPEPTVCDSGNGFHLWLRIDDLPLGSVGEETTPRPSTNPLVRRFIKGLALLLDTDHAKIDPVMGNPARVIKLYGTWSRKGDDTADRPHRQSKVLHTATHGKAITDKQLIKAVEIIEADADQPNQVNDEDAAHQTNTSPGTDFNQRGDWDFVFEHGFSVHSRAGGMTKLSHESAANDVSATIGCRSRNGSELFTNFSQTIAAELGLKVHGNDPYPSYDKFGLFAALNHRGDFHAAASELGKLGFGSTGGDYKDNQGDNDDAEQDEQTANKPSRRRVAYTRITSAELQDGDYSLEYLVKGVMVVNQPMIVAGPQKSLKTSLLIDLAITLSCGGCFLGRFPATRAAKVCVMTGESGMATIQETAIRVADAAGRELRDLDTIWSPDLPKFDDADHHDALKELLTDDEIEVLVIDPAYLSMPAADAGNVFAQGELLRKMTDVCGDVGVQLVLAHHTKKSTAGERLHPLALSDIAWSGFAEFARQWILVNRREEYESGSGEHRMWLSVGGSAGHNGLYATDVSEGSYDADNPRPRVWDVTVASATAARAEANKRKEDKKLREQEAKANEHRRRLLNAIRQFPDGETKTTLKTASGLNTQNLSDAITALLKEGRIETCQVKKGNKGKYDGWKPTKHAFETAKK